MEGFLFISTCVDTILRLHVKIKGQVQKSRD